jgi:hypothetical protein
MKEYSFLDVSLIVNGHPIEDWPDGDDIISASRLEDTFSHMTGADGRMFVIRNANVAGQVVFKLQQSGKGAEFLSELVLAHEVGLFIPVAVQMQDLRGNDLSTGSKGYITKPADMTRGMGINSSEWTIIVEDLYIKHGAGDELSASFGA